MPMPMFSTLAMLTNHVVKDAEMLFIDLLDLEHLVCRMDERKFCWSSDGQKLILKLYYFCG